MNQFIKVSFSVCAILLITKNLVFGMMDDDEERPAEHKHPTASTVTKDPVVAADGQSYEREAIARWLTTSQRNPSENGDLPHTSSHQKFTVIAELTKRLDTVTESTRQFAEAIDRPFPLAISEIAQGYEDVFRRFYHGKLIYCPTEGSDVGKIELPIAALSNPLDGTFDLSRCGDTGQHLSISTGYRKGYKSENANKVEIWFVPRFLVAREFDALAPNHHMREILKTWDAAQAPIGIFWTWGGWTAADHMQYCDHLTTQSMSSLGTENLYKKWDGQRGKYAHAQIVYTVGCTFTQASRTFYISFPN